VPVGVAPATEPSGPGGGQVRWTPRTTPSPDQLPPRPRGRTVANTAAYLAPPLIYDRAARSWSTHGRRADMAQTARKRPRKATRGRTWAKAQVMLMKWRHLIRKPAKLTGRHQARAMYMGGAHLALALVWVA
jgi:hypothetical protein